MSAGTCTAAQITNEISLNNINKVIPDHTSSGVVISTNLSSNIGEISAVTIHLKIVGGYNGDLYAYLRHSSPTGTNMCVLLNRTGRSSGNPHGYGDAGFDVQFTSAAGEDVHNYRLLAPPASGGLLTGVWQPDGRMILPSEVTDASPRQTDLDAFAGADASGEWTFFVADLDPGVASALEAVQIEVAGTEVAPPVPPEINFARLDGQQFEIGFPGVPNRAYDIETTATLSPATWQPWTNVTAGSTGLIKISGGFQKGDASQFFRAVAR